MSNDAINEILQRYDPYIIELARKKVPRNVVHPAVLADEAEELAQKVRIKLWGTLRKRPIRNFEAYIRRIVYSEVIDLVRRCRSKPCLSLNDDEELYQENSIFASTSGTQDPLDMIEREEAIVDSMQQIVTALLGLPPRQLQAMTCALKDRLDDILPIIDALEKSGIDVDEINWPKRKDESRCLRVSLSIARKKLRFLKRR
jgi:RNA polymerase sigma factor (sigma-70 family)